ncbi:MarR family winged helix-turn-helix transcriptional regulator [Floccifex sp.]|uniref:MarR family winged helix-turn-helix transcriptional regulator n=1 Tax=Floccifex sp. TaxID=2815810 RepID=UPI002A7528E3|nr:MarR family transcriptional regulator [Floccifex sp.]MDD7281534.1 MarR family transcriptional regulator [Erysipelotrichaceae bacterium]MDY2957948.1 MarR family transcriptional regulator [Floccifex sp.]
MDSETYLMLKSLQKHIQEGVNASLVNGPECHFPALHRLFVIIDKHGENGKIAVKDISIINDLLPQSVSRTLKKLEDDGLIIRTTDPLDRRKVYVELSEYGLQAHSECENRLLAFVTSVEQELGAENLNLLNQCLYKLDQAVQIVNANRGELND